MSIRINKFLSEAGVSSRRGGDAAVGEGRVTIDGRIAKLGDVVEPTQEVRLDGVVVRQRTERWYVLFNKPIGVITTTDPSARDNVMEAVAKAGWPVKEKRVVPVGRLDVASGGLLLLTNDTEVAERMLRKEGRHEKEYLVTVDQPVSQEAVDAWTKGMDMLGQRTLPAKVRMLKPDHFSITLVQGLNRQIRRMCEAFGYRVKVLKRVRIMQLHLDRLEPGQYRELSSREAKDLRRAVGLDLPKIPEPRPRPSSRNFHAKPRSPRPPDGRNDGPRRPFNDRRSRPAADRGSKRRTRVWTKDAGRDRAEAPRRESWSDRPRHAKPRTSDARSSQRSELRISAKPRWKRHSKSNDRASRGRDERPAGRPGYGARPKPPFGSSKRRFTPKKTTR